MSIAIRRGALAFLLIVAGSLAQSAAPKHEIWVGAWGFAPTSATPDASAATNRADRQPVNFHNVTVRQLVRIAVPTRKIRIRFSNEFGDQALRLGAVRVALSAGDGAIVPGSDHIVTFAGQLSASVPANAPLFSDAIAWNLPALATLAISTFIPEETVPPAHRVSAWVSSTGNFTDSTALPGAQLVRTGALVSAVDVVSPKARRVIVALGDSITEGVGSTVNAFRGWPDRLAERLAASGRHQWSVVNAGIGSNRLLHNDPGKGALARFDRDVLAVPNVGAVLMLEGINDIGYSHTRPTEAVSADEIIGAYQQLIARAHAHGIAIFAGTIPPFEDSHYYDLKGEQVRQAVNQWLRTSRAFDGIVDFDAVLRDDAHPTQVKAALHRGDHLHPNDAGYAAMGDAVDLGLLPR